MLEPLYTADEMKAAEAGHDVQTLMERAGRAVAEIALERFPDARRFACVCGKGANGGDGRIAARILRDAGRQAEETGDPAGADVVLDALFGTGFRGEPRAEAAGLIEAMNAAGAPIVAVDVPSGVDASSGETAGPSVNAAVTISFHGAKVGHHVAPGRFRRGELVLADIGLDERVSEHKLVTPEILRLVPRKRPEDTKYTAGAVLVVGGAPGMTGAACLAAEAAFRADAGYVAVAVPEASLAVVEAKLLEPVKLAWSRVGEAVTRIGAAAIGPGMGRSAEARALVASLLAELDVPVVLDADALHELEPFERGAPTVLTPHAGELGRLLGESSDWVAAHRLAAVRRAADRFGCTVLLKGADTLVATPGDGVLVSGRGTSALATAGTGDVLTGIVAAFLAKGLEPSLAAAAAATLEGLAAERGPRAGLVAGDLPALLPEALAAVTS
jgi:NAD(P)H-hydrate epimerase